MHERRICVWGPGVFRGREGAEAGNKSARRRRRIPYSEVEFGLGLRDALVSDLNIGFVQDVVQQYNCFDGR